MKEKRASIEAGIRGYIVTIFDGSKIITRSHFIARPGIEFGKACDIAYAEAKEFCAGFGCV